MTFINEETKEINCKIVYYGPSLSGRRTNMEYIYDTIPLYTKSKWRCESTKLYSLIIFDFLPKEMYMIEGHRLRYYLCSDSSCYYYPLSRQVVLEGIDGLIFVADSQVERMDANIECFSQLKNNLEMQGKDLADIPYALQLNKRELPNILDIDELKKKLMYKDEPVFESVAYRGIGVYETFKYVADKILQNIQNNKI